MQKWQRLFAETASGFPDQFQYCMWADTHDPEELQMCVFGFNKLSSLSKVEFLAWQKQGLVKITLTAR